MRHKTIIVFTALALAYTPGAVSTSQESGLSITGTYTLTSDAAATLEIKAEGTHYEALLSGGSPQVAGAAAPADCYIRVMGKLQGNKLAGNFTAIETDTFMYSEAQAQEEKRKVEIIFDSDTAEVVRADTFGYCGLGANFMGHYLRNLP